MLDEDQLLGLLGLILITMATYLPKVRKKRRFKTRLINRNRKRVGFYVTTFLPMKENDPEEFFAYTRMDVELFTYLLNLIKPKLKERRLISDSINNEMRLAITLQYLSQGVSMRSLAWSYQIGRTTAHLIVKEVCAAIWDVLYPIYLKPKTEEDWKNIATEFFAKWNFPNCIGALDGKHIAIEAPPHSGSLYHNYKSYFSTVLMALCDANYNFTCVDVGGFGSQHDGGIFRESTFGQRFEDNSMGVPPEANIPNTNIRMPYVIVADEAFPLKQYIFRPYPGRRLPLWKRIFNYRLSRARRVIENAFGILVARWRILKTTINADVDNVDSIVKAVVCLHNLCKQYKADAVGHTRYCPVGYADVGDQNNGGWRQEVENLRSVGRVAANNAQRQNYEMRNTLAEYFVSPVGMLPWQEERVNRGRNPN